MAAAKSVHVDRVLAAVGRQAEPESDNVVSRSWSRSGKAYAIDPNSSEPPRILSMAELRGRRDATSELAQVARVELDRLYQVVRGARYVVLLCCQEGVVIDYRGDEGDAEAFRHGGSWLGGVWSEVAEGTNAIGTCAAECRPVTIHRSQHFRSRYIDLSCSGAPIFDPDCRFAGVLDVSSTDPRLSEHSHGMSGALTVAFARGIEERWFRKAYHRHWIVAIGQSDEDGAGMLLAVDNDRQIVGASRFARRLMRISSDGPVQAGVGVWTLLERNDALFRHRDRGDILAELRPVGRDVTWSAAITPPRLSLGRWRDSLEEDIHLRPRLDTLPRKLRAINQTQGGISPAKLRRIRDYVDENLDQPLNLKALAATADLSVYHFARSFKQSEGTSPHAYVLERRIAKARELLARTDLTLSEIALEVGFADQSHFARRFRQAVGVSPGRYRRPR